MKKKKKIKNWDDKEDYTKDYSVILGDLICPAKTRQLALLDRRGSYLIVPNPSNRTNRLDIYCFKTTVNIVTITWKLGLTKL